MTKTILGRPKRKDSPSRQTYYIGKPAQNLIKKFARERAPKNPNLGDTVEAIVEAVNVLGLRTIIRMAEDAKGKA